MVRISETDPAKATRMYYMYFSDTWFFDTEDEYMYLYSDLMALILLKYIKTDLSIDFKTLQKDIQHKEGTLFEKVLTLFTTQTQTIKQMVETADYYPTQDKKHKLDYPKMNSMLISLFKKNPNNKTVPLDSTGFVTPYWINMIGYLKKFTDKKEILEKYLQDQEKLTLKKVMVLSCGNKVAQKYQFNHRNYVIEKMESLGLVAE